MAQFQPGLVASAAKDRDELRAIAARQKGVLVCILLYFLAVIVQFLIPEEMRPVLAAGAIAVIIAGAVFVFMLATRLYGVLLGVVLGILTLIPLLGLIVLLMINSKATSRLRREGVDVGLLGASGRI